MPKLGDSELKAAKHELLFSICQNVLIQTKDSPVKNYLVVFLIANCSTWQPSLDAYPSSSKQFFGNISHFASQKQ